MAPLRLAVFGGVYANAGALRATLDDIELQHAAHTWCLGDLGGFGPAPEEAIAMLRAVGIPTVQGNVDHSLGHSLDHCACGYTDPEDERWAQASYDFTTSRVSEGPREWLRALPREARFTFGARRVLLCHGSPRRQNEFLWESACSDPFLAWLCTAYEADLIVCSHTGIPWHRALPSGQWFVNCGAVGRPAHDGRTSTGYVVIEDVQGELAVRHRDVRYDHEAVAREVEAAGLPPPFAETLRTGWWTTCLGNVPVRERLRACSGRVRPRRLSEKGGVSEESTALRAAFEERSG